MTTAMVALTVFFFVFLAGASSVAARGHRISRESSSLSREELADMAGYGEDKISTILVTGSVLCDYHGRHLPSQPVSGAVVGINCGGSRRSRRRRSSSRGRGRGVMIKGVTDDYGDFTIDLPSSLHAIPNLHKRCFLTLLGLPTHLSRRCIKPSPKHHSHHRNKPMLLLTSSEEEEDNGARTYSAGTIKLRSRQPELNPDIQSPSS